MCAKLCNGADAGICDGAPSTGYSFYIIYKSETGMDRSISPVALSCKSNIHKDTPTVQFKRPISPFFS